MNVSVAFLTRKYVGTVSISLHCVSCTRPRTTVPLQSPSIRPFDSYLSLQMWVIATPWSPSDTLYIPFYILTLHLLVSFLHWHPLPLYSTQEYLLCAPNKKLICFSTVIPHLRSSGCEFYYSFSCSEFRFSVFLCSAVAPTCSRHEICI